MFQRLGFLISASIFFTSLAHAETWRVATLEWPPYICSQCPQNGAAASALRKALETKDVKVEFVFSPWLQTLKRGADRNFVGYFPAWREEVKPTFTASDVFFSSPLIILERSTHPLKWGTLKDLKGKIIGVTTGYGNTKEFNDLVKEKIIKTSETLNEESLFRKLAEGKMDGILIDMYVAQYYLNEMFPQLRSKLRVNPKIVEVKTLHFAFNQANKDKVTVLHQSLKSFNFNKAVDTYLKEQKQAENLVPTVNPTKHLRLSKLDK